MRVRVIASLVMVLGLAAGSASGSSIGIYFAADGTDCDATAAPFSPVNWWILGHFYGDAAVDGITGVEFRVDGWPAGWFGTPTKNAAFGTELGNPLTGGVNLAAATCQTGAGGWITLYSVSGFATSAVGPTTMAVNMHTNPSNPNYLCPLMVLCDIPVYTKICVSGGEAFLNGGACTVGVEPATWSQVKGLYN
jgi:hypothetical protein